MFHKAQGGAGRRSTTELYIPKRVNIEKKAKTQLTVIGRSSPPDLAARERVGEDG